MTLRPVTLGDVNRLFEWRNDPGTLASLPNSVPVLRKSHRAWVVKRMKQPHFYILEVRGVAIGTGRLDATYTMSVTLAPEHRGKGYAVHAIKTLRKQVKDPVWAHVVPTNLVSLHAFTQAGFIRV